MRGPAFTAAGGAESGVVSKVDKDGRPPDTGVGPPNAVGSVNAGVALGAVDISATEEIELAGGGISSGWVAAVVPGRALPPGKKTGKHTAWPGKEGENGREREKERERKRESENEEVSENKEERVRTRKRERYS